MFDSSKRTEMAFSDLVKQRVSCRSYRPDPVPKKKLKQLLEAARLAPSACNRQPWRFAIITDAATRLRLINESFLPGIPMSWAENAGAIIVLGMTRSPVTHHIATKISGVDYPLLDLGIAGEHMVLQAEALGLGTCWIGWIQPKKVRRIIGWPRTIEVVSLLTVGWPVGERSVRPRLSSEDIATWI